MSKKKNLAYSTKIKFPKLSKKLVIPAYAHLTFKQSVPRFGSFFIQAAESGTLSKNQIESARVTLKRPFKHVLGTKIWVLVKPNVITTKRAAGTRMGHGKGSPFSQIILISKGQLLYEIKTKSMLFYLLSVFQSVKKKLPLQTNLFWLTYGAV